MWNQRSSRWARSARSLSGSTAPVLVVPGRADHDERRQAGLAVDVDGGVDRRRLQAVVGVRPEDAQVRRVEAEHAPRLEHRGVGVLGDVAGGLVAVVGARVRGRGERGERADAAAADEDALGVRGHAHPVAQPVEHGELERRRARPAGPAAGERVVPGADQVGEDAHRVARAADPGEEAGVIGALSAREDRRRRARRSPASGRSARPGTAGSRRGPGRIGRARSAAERRARPSDRPAGPTRSARATQLVGRKAQRGPQWRQ